MVQNMCAVFLICLGLFSTAVASCPPSSEKTVLTWTYRSSCYNFHRRKARFEEAEKECVHHGGQLASIHTLGFNNFLVFMMNRALYDGVAWIGLHDKEIENRFQWLDGSVLDFKNWGKGEGPRTGIDHAYEDCVGLSAKDKKWHDFRCPESRLFGLFAYEHPFICQNKMPATTTVAMTNGTTRQKVKLTTEGATEVTTPSISEESSKPTYQTIPDETSKPADSPTTVEPSESTDA